MVVLQCLAAISEEETSLFVKQCKGLHNRCRKFGHKGTDCRMNGVKSMERTEQLPGSFSGKYFHCGLHGNKKADCNRRKQKHETSSNEKVLLS